MFGLSFQDSSIITLSFLSLACPMSFNALL
jgi:hypothetical protein